MHNNVDHRWLTFSSCRMTSLGLLLVFGNMFSPVVNAQVGMGLAGDSIIDDYLGPSAIGNTNLAAGSFGQILGELRADQIDFGDYMSVEDGTWDSIRYSGYEYKIGRAHV